MEASPNIQTDESIVERPSVRPRLFLILSAVSGLVLLPLVAGAALLAASAGQGWESLGYLFYGAIAGVFAHFFISTAVLAHLHVRRYGLVSAAGNGILYGTLLVLASRNEGSASLNMPWYAFVAISPLLSLGGYPLFRWLFGKDSVTKGLAVVAGLTALLYGSYLVLGSWASATSEKRESSRQTNLAEKLDFTAYVLSDAPRGITLKEASILDKREAGGGHPGFQLVYGKKGIESPTIVIYEKTAEGSDPSRCSLYDRKGADECGLIGTTKQGYQVYSNTSRYASPNESEAFFKVENTVISVKFTSSKATKEALVHLAESMQAKSESDLQSLVKSDNNETDSGRLSQFGLEAYVPINVPEGAKLNSGYVFASEEHQYLALKYFGKQGARSVNFVLYERKPDGKFNPPSQCATAHPELGFGAKNCRQVATAKDGTEVYMAEDSGKPFYVFMKGNMLITATDEYGLKLTQDEVVSLVGSLQKKTESELKKEKILKD